MNVTSILFDAYLKCPTKCFLKSCGETDGRNAYANCIQTESENYRNQERKRLMDALPSGEWIPSLADMGNLKNAKWRLAVDLAARTQDLASNIHAVERVLSEGRGRPTLFVPVRFVVSNKLTRDDRLLVAFDAFLLSEIVGRNVPFSKIIYGDHHAMLKVNTLALAGKVQKLTVKTATLLSKPSPPDLILNRHCAACEFQYRCREKAVEKDDLSLLPRMTEKERRTFHSRGIFTVTQLSHTFRPRRNPKRIAQKPRKYYHALKALAIRERKIHVVGSPELNLDGTPVYLDVEGLPDRDFYYLIGARFKSAQQIVQQSLWADSKEQERRIWSDFLTLLSEIKNPVLIHYGSYESTFLKQMSQRYGNPEKNLAAATLTTSLNLLSIMFGSVYFPHYSNGLKDCAKSLGFEWSTPNASGALAVVWRLQWEKDRSLLAKELLIKYNAEDCEALQHLTEFVTALRLQPPNSRTTVNLRLSKLNLCLETLSSSFERYHFKSPNLRRLTKLLIGNINETEFL